jgi:hypothetical protein
MPSKRAEYAYLAVYSPEVEKFQEKESSVSETC